MGSSLRVGISVARLELPSPSGAITYRLREPAGPLYPFYPRTWQLTASVSF